MAASMTSVSGRPPRPLWRRLLRPMLVVAGLVVVFVWVLPQFIDYDDVWSALKQLDAWELAALSSSPSRASRLRRSCTGRSCRPPAHARKRGISLLEPGGPTAAAASASSSSTATSAAAAGRMPQRSPRSDRSSSRPSVGSCSRSSRYSYCSLPATPTGPSSGGRSVAGDHQRGVHRRLVLPAARVDGAPARRQGAAAAVLDPPEAQAGANRRWRRPRPAHCDCGRSSSYARVGGWVLAGVASNLFLTYLILLAALRFVRLERPADGA